MPRHIADNLKAVYYDSTDPNTIDGLTLCKSWLQQCITSHDSCSPPTGSTPTRLIDLSEQEPRLCFSEDLQTRPTYVTLSHCWGSTKFMTLSKEYLIKFTDRISSEALPKTFLDAIHIAKSLGFQYLWIDSLCIVQDDMDDWNRESALMTSVYGCSSLNIAASSAKDGSFGCLYPRKRTWRCQVPLKSSDDIVLYDCVAEKAFVPSDDDIPLHSRAWVLQELFLPSRKMHFFKEQIFWKCNETSACEMLPVGYPFNINLSLFDYAKQSVNRADWFGIIGRYSSGQLTHLSDKLVALAGLARYVHTQDKDEYIAGMWKTKLEAQLCWQVSRSGT